MNKTNADSNLIARVLGYAVTVEGRRTEYFRTEMEAAEFADRTARGLGWTAKQDGADWEVSLKCDDGEDYDDDAVAQEVR